MSANAPALTAAAFKPLLRHMDVALACGVIGVLVVMVVPLPTALSRHFPLRADRAFAGRPAGNDLQRRTAGIFRIPSAAADRHADAPGAQHRHRTPDPAATATAGVVISVFGQFVVGGNYIVGAAIFLILLIIQFVVITKGSGRVAEVAARFTLDAMPGKQMAIDADLNAGLINEEQARDRRKKIEREANFYGAMDGASKFVRGDAVAALIITAVNLVGGLAIACLQRGMSPADGLKHFALLTIGDGLVTQIPALLISTASGILVTRSASDLSLGEDFGRQLFMRHKAPCASPPSSWRSSPSSPDCPRSRCC